MKEQLRLQLGGSALTPIDSNVEVLLGPLHWAAAISCLSLAGKQRTDGVEAVEGASQHCGERDAGCGRSRELSCSPACTGGTGGCMLTANVTLFSSGC